MINSIGKIENFFEENLIKKLLSKYEYGEKKDNGLRQNVNTFIEQDFNNLLRENIESHINKHFPNLVVSHATIYSDYASGGIHTDGYIGQPEKLPLGLTFLVPLESSHEGNATIIFNETNDEAVTYNSSTGLKDKGISTYKQVHAPRSNKGLDKTFCEFYLPHLDANGCDLSVAGVLYWKVGCAMFWPRNRFHSSAWFPNGITRKAIVVLTNDRSTSLT